MNGRVGAASHFDRDFVKRRLAKGSLPAESETLFGHADGICVDASVAVLVVEDGDSIATWRKSSEPCRDRTAMGADLLGARVAPGLEPARALIESDENHAVGASNRGYGHMNLSAPGLGRAAAQSDAPEKDSTQAEPRAFSCFSGDEPGHTED